MSIQQLETVIDRFDSIRNGWTEATTMFDIRADIERFYEPYPITPGTETSVTPDGTEHSVRAGAADEAVILYFHGGGFITGSPRAYRPFATHLARAAEARVIMQRFRQAPEHCYPAAHDDAFNAYRGLLDDGVAPGRIVVGGDSAGGGLAIALLVRLRDAGIALPTGAILLSPWADIACDGASYVANAAIDPIATRDMAIGMGETYLNGAADPRHPHISAIYDRLAGLPPVLIQTGEREIFVDDSTRLASLIEAAGGSVALEIWPGMIHQWQLHVGVLDESAAAIAKLADFVRRRTAP